MGKEREMGNGKFILFYLFSISPSSPSLLNIFYFCLSLWPLWLILYFILQNMDTYSKSAIFRQLLKKGVVVMPGAFNAATALLIEKIGFEAVYISGAGLSNGMAGIEIEEQEFPKRGGHLPGKKVMPGQEMEEKIRAACDARENPDFLIIVRTDS